MATLRIAAITLSWCERSCTSRAAREAMSRRRQGEPLALQSQYAEELTDKLGLRFREKHKTESVVRGGVRGGV